MDFEREYSLFLNFLIDHDALGKFMKNAIYHSSNIDVCDFDMGLLREHALDYYGGRNDGLKSIVSGSFLFGTGEGSASYWFDMAGAWNKYYTSAMEREEAFILEQQSNKQYDSIW